MGGEVTKSRENPLFEAESEASAARQHGAQAIPWRRGRLEHSCLHCSYGLQGVLPWTSVNSSDNKCGVYCPFVFEGPALGGDEASQGASLRIPGCVCADSFSSQVAVVH